MLMTKVLHPNLEHGKIVRLLCDGSSDRSFMVDPLNSKTGVTKAVVCVIPSVG